jgi:hypothetical protein
MLKSQSINILKIFSGQEGCKWPTADAEAAAPHTRIGQKRTAGKWSSRCTNEHSQVDLNLCVGRVRGLLHVEVTLSN